MRVIVFMVLNHEDDIGAGTPRLYFVLVTYRVLGMGDERVWLVVFLFWMGRYAADGVYDTRFFSSRG